LSYRRLRFDLIQYYKILNNLTPLNYAKYFTYHQPSSSSRKPSLFLIKPMNSPNYLFSSFVNRSVDYWNSLPQTLKEVNSLGTFRKNVFMVDLHMSSFLIGSANLIFRRKLIRPRPTITFIFRASYILCVSFDVLCSATFYYRTSIFYHLFIFIMKSCTKDTIRK